MISEFKLMSAYSQSLCYAGASLDALQKDSTCAGLLILARPKNTNHLCYSRKEGHHQLLIEALTQAMLHDPDIADIVKSANRAYRDI